MKKSMSRILSLALVLAMMVSVVPFALAAQTVDRVELSSETASVNVGEIITLQATVHLTGELGENEVPLSTGVTWSSTSGHATVDASGVVTGVSAGTATIVATSVADGTKSATCVVTVNQVIPVESVSIAETLPLTYGDEVTPAVTVLPDTATNKSYTLESSDPTVLEVLPNGISVKAVKSGDATLTVTTADGNFTDTCAVTVAPSYAVEASVDEETLVIGQKAALTYSAKKDGKDFADAKWAVSVTSGSSYISLNEAKTEITAVKAGTSEVTVALVDTDGKTLTYDTVTVEVVDIAIDCDNASGAAGSAVTLTPKLTNFDGDVTYTYSTKTSGVSLSSNTGSSVIVRSSAETAAKVTITASYKLDGVQKTTSKDVMVYFYDDHTAAFTIKSGVSSFTFEDNDVFSAIKYDTSYTNLNQSVRDVLTTTGAYEIKLTLRSATTATTIGTLSSLYEPLSTISNIKFTLNGKSGTQYIDYELLSKEGLKVATGTIAFTTDGSSGDIVYETDYNTPITFDEDDFEKFWTNSSKTTGSLKYVVFSVGTSTPSYGKLYTTSAKTKSVTSRLMFQPNYVSSSEYYDLDAVYYVPDTSYKTSYTVEIPFTAYGGATGTQTLTGTVVIELNGSSTNITSRGVVFGSGTTSLVDLMAADYKGVNKTDLVSVVFTLPDVEDGRLYYNYDGIMDSTRVTSKDEYYVDATTKQLDLEKVAFIPAADKSGKVTIYYTGYGKDGSNPYEGKLTLNVTTKTKSDKFTDVTSTSYSWAADAIDFLYYEEVVNGTSSTKYSPAASITRGDFMIMLYRAFLEEDYGSYNVTSNFADVPKGTTDYQKETYQAVGVAKYLGIAKGDGTNFNPKSRITREEAMTLIYRTLDEVNMDLEYTSTKTTASFSDYSKVSSYAQTPISYLIKHGVVIGSDGKISPKSNITRAEMAVILHRVLTY